jgi:hypothetical protein
MQQTYYVIVMHIISPRSQIELLRLHMHCIFNSNDYINIIITCMHIMLVAYYQYVESFNINWYGRR